MTVSEIGVDHEHSALGLAEGCALCGGRGYIRWTVFFVYPYVFVAGPNKHDTLLIIACADGTRNSTDRNMGLNIGLLCLT